MKKANKKKRKSTYIDLKKCTPAFKAVYTDYLNSLKAKTFDINLSIALTEYRKEKIRMLPDKDVIKEECGEEFGRYGRAITYSTQYCIKKTELEPLQKQKDGKLGVITLFKKFNREGKFDPPGVKVKPFKYGPLKKKMIIEPFEYQNKKNNDLKTEKTSTLPYLFTQSSQFSSNYSKTEHNKFRKTSQRNIEMLADSVSLRSRNLTKGMGESFTNFQNKFDKWKKIKTYLIPEIQLQE